MTAEIRSFTSSEETVNTTTHTHDYPATISLGDTLLSSLSLDDDDNNAVWPSSGTVFTELHETINNAGADDMTMTSAWAEADGTEDGGTFDVTVDGGERSTAVCFAISGAADPDTSPPEVGTAAIGTSVSPDPPSLTPSGGSDDYLYFAIHAYNQQNSVTGFPTGYTDTGTIDPTIENGSGGLGWASKSTTGSSSDDPGVFTITSFNWVAQTFAIYPSAAAAALIGENIIRSFAVTRAANY